MKTTRWTIPVRGEDDICALEAQPYEQLVPSRSIYEVFEANAELHGDRPALTVLATPDPSSVSVSFTHSQFFGEITKVANLLSSLDRDGIPTVAILARNYATLPAIIWGGQTAGVVSCLNYLLSSDVIRQLLAAEKATVLVVPGPKLDADLWNKVAPILPELPEIKDVLVLGGLPEDLVDPRLVDFDTEVELHTSSYLVRPRETGRDTVASILHTGGTTGLPKLVPQTHGNQIHAAWTFAQMFAIDETDVIINGMPMFHVGGTITFHLSVMAAAGHMILTAPAGFRDPAVIANYWATVERFRATMAGGVPTTIASIADTPVGGHDISSLRMALTGGAILPSTVAARFEARAGIPLLEQYGMTETLANIATTPFHGEKRRGSVGYRAPFGGIRVGSETPDDGQGDGAPADVIGPVSARGPNVFPGYLSAKHCEGLFVGDGWMCTGDIGFVTPKGQLVLTGREKDLIIRSAHNIDPAVIEEVANSHPDISLSAAVGMPDAYAGEVPVIFVEPVHGKDVDVAELLHYITGRVPEPPAKPRHVFVVSEIPKTGVGKIFKPALREQAIRKKIADVLAGIDPAATADVEVDMLSGKVPKVRISVPDENVRQRLLVELQDLNLDIRAG